MKNFILKKRIFGTDFKFIISKKKDYFDILKKELSYYQNYDSSQNEILVYMDSKPFPKIDVSPSTLISSENIFGIKDLMFDYCWIKDNLRIKEIVIKTNFEKINPIYKIGHFFLGKDLTHLEGLIGKFLHENILVPTQILLGKSVFHGSSFKFEDKSYVIGGTGGVGKTSAILSLKSKSLKFLADDMTVLNSNREIEENLSFPKIYAYNVIGNKSLESDLLNSSGVFFKFFWKFFKFYNPNLIRKRISPDFLMSLKNKNEQSFLTNYLVLIKGNFNNFSREKIDHNLLSELSLDILENEYCLFFNHLKWHNLNSQINSFENKFNNVDIKKRYIKMNKSLLKKVNCEVIKIPNNSSHKDYLDYIKENLI